MAQDLTIFMLSSAKKEKRMLGNGGSQLREVIRQSTVNKSMAPTQVYIKVCSIGKLFLIFRHHPVPDSERDTSFQVELSLIKANLLHKKAFSTWFSKILLVLLFLKIISPK